MYIYIYIYIYVTIYVYSNDDVTDFSRNFTWFNNYLFGNCFTFNANADNGNLKTNKIGPLYG